MLAVDVGQCDNRAMPKNPARETVADTENAETAPNALSINAKPYRHGGAADMPLLWYLRDVLRLTGAKFGCDSGECGACSVLVDDKLARACEVPMRELAGRRVTTIEGLETDTLHALQQAWIEEDAISCGYCQGGQIIAAADLLRRKPNPRDADIAKLTNLCRCGTYPRIRHAILRAAAVLRGDDADA
jgi:isoquinoline 1-oxidoreductase alpha subunit